MLPKAHFVSAFAVLALLVACDSGSSTTAPDSAPTAKGMHGITITAPNGGETFKAGDSISLKWTADLDSLNSAKLLIRCGSGSDNPLFGSSVTPDTSAWGNMRVKIPSSLSGSCMIKIQDYQMTWNYDTTDTRFTVNP